ncbi:Alpha/Beta hydrolase protein [Bipolaris maydis]|nr:Alpha/Beta hydrolase protein [Bipolaris maydis]
MPSFPPTPRDVKVVQSQLEEGVRISYKEAHQTVRDHEGVRSFSGYVHLPAGALADLGVQDQTYEINTYFWFFESRKDPKNAPLSVWMNGGPGSSSMLGLLRENGPCFVHSDSNSTYINEWSWNNEVNMLYLDQPVQVGLSYDSLVVDFQNTPIPAQNNSFYVGTYPSQNSNFTTRGTENSARALWNFAQIWFQEILWRSLWAPPLRPTSRNKMRRLKTEPGMKLGETHILHLDTLLIINGCIDRYVQWPGYPVMAYNNTYGIQAVNESRYQEVLDNLYRKGGCLEQIEALIATVNEACEAAETFCSEKIRDPYFDTDLNYYDISAPGAASYPPPWYQGFLNQPHVQQDLGVSLNWTQSNSAVSKSFRSIGDYPRPNWKEDLAYLLEEGIKVTLVYGDRDYACNWYGGELLSLAIPYENATSLPKRVRQFGNLSFTRVYEAGHEVPAYQPETAYRIFMRSLFNRDISTGNVSTANNASYATEGPIHVSNITNVPIIDPGAQCYVLDPGQCTKEQWKSVMNGTALVRNWIVVDANTSHLFPRLDIQ